MKNKRWTKLDPSRTKTERQQFMREMKRRLRALMKEIMRFLVIEDELGLTERKPFVLKLLASSSKTGKLLSEKKIRELAEYIKKNYRRYAFMTTPQKLTQFQEWLQQQVDAGLLQVDANGKPWTAKYVESSWRKGMFRSYTDVRKEKLTAQPEWYRGTKEQWLRSAFMQPEMMSKVQLLAMRSFNDMKGLTSTMSSQMSRILADGMAKGSGPMKIARLIDRDVFKGRNRARALTIARTEIIHAHAEGQLDGLKELGVDQVTAEVEWSTAGDKLVCSQCESLEGSIFTIDEAKGRIPLHPNCRCAWVPYIKTTKKRIRRKRKGRK